MTLSIPAGERGRIRVYALSMTDKEGRALAAEPAARAAILGAESLDPEYVDVFPVKNLEGLGLVGYLVEGHGAVAAEVERDKQKLSALSGHVLVAMSKAFGKGGMELEPDPRLTLIGVYGQEGVDYTPVSVTSEAADPSAEAPAKKPMSDARISGMVATAVLLFLAAFVMIFILLAG
ncbi:MAG: hypothetical protein AAGH73_00390 [Pseudomonadota bacterium]